MTGWDDISSLKDKLQANPIVGDPNRVLLLACHGSMATSEQVILELAKHKVVSLLLGSIHVMWVILSGTEKHFLVRH